MIRKALAATVLLVAVASPARARGDDASIQVNWTKDNLSVLVQSSKDLSNVVLAGCDGEHVKFDGLTGPIGTFSLDAPIVTAWVKSGSNASGDGPGYGERFDNEEAPCDTQTTTTTTALLTTTTTQPTAGTTSTTTSTLTVGPFSSDPPAPTYIEPSVTDLGLVPMPQRVVELPRTGSDTLLPLALVLVAAGSGIYAVSKYRRGHAH